MRLRVLIWFHSLLFVGALLLLANISLKLSAKTPRILNKRPEVRRNSVTLDDRVYTYHLNLSHFQEEYPHLQSYHCSLLYTPQLDNEGTSPILLLAIKSHPASVSRRAALRRTWAKRVEVMGYRVRPVFLMALSDHDKQMEIVKVEKAEYEDILLWDFMEGHHNLSLKERCFLEWLHYNPHQANFIFKGDDDVFVNPSSLVRYIKEHPSPSTLHGALQRHSVVLRYSKYQVSNTLFPNPKYPYFLSGGGFLFPGASVRPLYRASLRLPVFPLDDVYFGFLSLAANLTLHHDSRFYVFGLKFDPCDYQRALVVHRTDPDHLLQIWGDVQQAQCNGTTPNKK
ncbi:acetylgalactosaminyl-O-glycosyl-glycoprotein beta-1,3-N-acetylglucosaminyltransferase-like [Leptodactylus fuscus]|uniref:acetylgalactosaminyl-O-glycosyl-glycoprotein beta-1,3-N-acetylglucosaminyltransferase-like n=1 Tax=Leptodactylus fuscus TaxID=238119 RepID=UPI003F4ED1F5